MRFNLSSFALWPWFFAVKLALAQQFPFIKTQYEALGLSEPCFEALNTTVACADKLARHVVWDSSSVDLLNEDALAVVCEDTCRQSLVDLRTKISSTCDPTTDTIHYGYMTYPATYIAERYLYFYDVSCYKDVSSGQFCDAVVAGWRNETGGSGAHMCEDCWLGPMSVQLSSPIGYDEERARNFASLTSSCSVDTYTVATPSPYGEADATVASLLTTAVAATATPTTGEISTASEVPSSVETPMIYPLLELGTSGSASADTGVELSN